MPRKVIPFREKRNPLLMSQLEGSCEKLGVRQPFFSVRTTAADVANSIRKEADEQLRACEQRMKGDAGLHVKFGSSHARTAHYLRCLADRIEKEGRDGA